MNRWCGKVGVVTGASAGIGEVIVKDLLKHGLKVVGLARRIGLMEENRSKLPKDVQGNYYPIKCDVSHDNEVKEAFSWIEKNLGGVDILVNNAGIYQTGSLAMPNSSDLLKHTMDVNVMGIVYCTREAFKSMRKRDVPGHVVMLNSITGHKVVRFRAKPVLVNIYAASKYAVTAMTEVYRMEFADEKTKVKVTSISPGLVDTNMYPEEFRSPDFPYLQSEDVSDAVMYVLGTPPHVQIHELIIKPVGETA